MKKFLVATILVNLFKSNQPGEQIISGFVEVFVLFY